MRTTGVPLVGFLHGWHDPCVIIWLNGPFGAGKTTTAKQLVGRLDNARHFDPELVGYLLRTALGDHDLKDFQDLPPWRELVPVFTEKIVDSGILAERIAERIKADQLDTQACQWRLDHISGYERSRPWMESVADLVIDTTNLPVTDVAERIATKAEKRIAEADH